MYKWICLLVIQFCAIISLDAQNIPSDRVTDWTNPGSLPPFNYTKSVSLGDFNADTSGIVPADSAFQQAVNALDGPGKIFIPKGVYLFEQTIVLQDSVIIEGETDTVNFSPLAKFKLSPGESQHGISVTGTETSTNYHIDYALKKGIDKIYVSQAQLFSTGDFIRLKAYDDSTLVNNNWAYHTTGQILEITAIEGDTLFLNKPLRRNYSETHPPEILKLNPVRQVHIKCLKLERLDITTAQTSNIFFRHAVDCSLSGIESTYCNFAHVDVRYSSRITVENNFFKDAHSHGGGGKAYGVMLQFGSGDCFIHQNNFEYLRHSMIMQAGANGNVFAYNYSTDPFWTLETLPLPSNSAGDLVLHGNYVYMNLMEGNVVQNIVIDNSHDINGPYNTFFRNRAELFGIFMNDSPASDSQNFIGNQVVHDVFGLYMLQGSGHFEYGNMIKGSMTPAQSAEPEMHTMFDYAFPSFYQNIVSVPPITTYNWQSEQPFNETHHRYVKTGQHAICQQLEYSAVTNSIQQLDYTTIPFQAYPNPFNQDFYIKPDEEISGYEVRLYNSLGQLVFESDELYGKTKIQTAQHLSGLYYVVLTADGNRYRLMMIKAE